MGAPHEQAPQPQPAPPSGAAAPTGASERQLCETLSGHAKLHVEDVPNGVAIVATPKGGKDLAIVRGDAHHISSALHERAHEQPPIGEACGLFSIGRLPDVNTAVTDTANSVRILMTTPNASEVKDLRRIAREQVGAMGGGGGAKKGR
jgi:hypothetical protein